MKKTYTAEEKKRYFQDLRTRWNAAKRHADKDEIEAVIMNWGINISVYSYCFVAVQMKALNYDGHPYLDCKTYQGWRENGFQVRKGETSKIDGITWIGVSNYETTDEGEIEKGYAIPKAYHLFHRSQVEAL